MRSSIIACTLLALTLVSCSRESPLQPTSRLTTGARSAGSSLTAARQAPGQPAYEPAFVDGRIVTINAIFVPGRAPEEAKQDIYLVVYPENFADLGLAPPMCDPCDHNGNGIDAGDFHDHVLDSAPADPGHGEFSPLWEVFAVAPAYNGNASHDAALNAAYAARLPARSEDAVNELLAAKLADGTPLATKADLNFYFVGSVVSENAAR